MITARTLQEAIIEQLDHRLLQLQQFGFIREVKKEIRDVKYLRGIVERGLADLLDDFRYPDFGD